MEPTTTEAHGVTAMTTREWTDREAEIIDEHVADFRKENDRNPDRGEMIEMFADRAAESDIAEAAEFDAIIANLR